MPWSDRTPGTFLAAVLHEAASPFGHRATVAELLGVVGGPGRLGRPSRRSVDPWATWAEAARTRRAGAPDASAADPDGGPGRAPSLAAQSLPAHPVPVPPVPAPTAPAAPALGLPAPGRDSRGAAVGERRAAPGHDRGGRTAPTSPPSPARAGADPAPNLLPTMQVPSGGSRLAQPPLAKHHVDRSLPESSPTGPHERPAAAPPVAPGPGRVAPGRAGPSRAGQVAPRDAGHDGPAVPTSLSSAVPWPSASVETGPARDITVERLSPALAAWLRDSPLPEGARQEASRMPPQVPEDPAVSQGRAGARAQPRADGVVDEPDASARARMLGHPRGGAGSALEAVRAATRAAAQPPPDYRQEPMPSTPSSDARAATPQPVARPPAPGRPVRSTRSDGGPVVTTLLTRMSVGRSGLRGLR